MVIFHSYVKLPEAMFISILGEKIAKGFKGFITCSLEQVNYGHLIVNYGYYGYQVD